ncbi:T9SS type A sorting domain-containing protein [Flavobacterium frigoris]|uniref:Por secretion system C-terminal sorting domain-containing protein n=1 Tax=Flavobacterium frigoris TaxID=229204 RepID=A0A1H9CXP5_FLAFI|nr:T9SS type A sorting domain-containing protein [Flavobacterium frigoris]SEQ05992.1 Por secretion system C-terminal sorting domain-containing protein [Flavobacterium frigoris]
MRKALLLLCALLSLNAFSQTNLVPNGNFENWSSSSQPDSWYGYFSGILSQSSIAQNGSSSTNMKIATGTLNFMNSEFFPVTINKTYRITLYHKLVSGTFSAIDLSLYHKPGTFKSEIIKKTDATFSSSEWRKIEFEYTATVSENIEVDVWTTGTENSEILVDNVSVVDVADVPVQYTLIPDAKFEAKLIALGIDSGIADGKVLTSKINTVASLDVSNSTISDLTGIQDFVALSNLDCSKNSLTVLDVSKNISLFGLNCFANKLTTIDVTHNIKLAVLNLGGTTYGRYTNLNNIATFDISHNLELEYLNCTGINLQSINVSLNKKLTHLILSSNQLSTLEVNSNTALIQFYCDSNQLLTLDVTKNTALTSLYCSKNLLTTLNISQNLQLDKLYTNNNQLTSLDVSKNLNLTVINCGSNEISSLDIYDNLLLTMLNCGNNNLTSLNTSKNTALINFYCHYNSITALNITTNVNLVGFMCHFNKLSEIDVSKNSKLEMFDCLDNQLVSLDISNNPKVTELACENNKLRYLNLKNGANTILDLTFSNFINNPNLTCIQVDDVDYASTNWSGIKDNTATYSSTCVLGLEDAVFDKVTVYPNPTKGEVNINNISLEKITVYNSVGQMMKSILNDSANINHKIDLSGLPKGIYYMYLINETTASVKKIILE